MSHRAQPQKYTALVISMITMLLAYATTLAGEETKQKLEKVIDFENEIVEGMNKRPLDSLTQLSEAERNRRKARLYRKRAGFRSETAETINALRYIP